MNILFITVADMRDVDTHGIYSDLMREFLKNGNNVYIASPAERRNKTLTKLIENPEAADWHRNLHILKIRTGNIQKTNFIEKGISTILIETQLKKGIKKHFNNVVFDLVLYTTPPITLVKPVSFVKKRDKALCYLLLKDIFPQNALDLGILSRKGIKHLLYASFRNKEKKLYRISDVIGCMSEANVEYVLKNNEEIPKNKVEVCPNTVEVMDLSVDEKNKSLIRTKYGLPTDKVLFVYGGNLGKPQGIDFLIKCLNHSNEIEDAYFLIIGNGTEYNKLKCFIDAQKPKNVKLLERLPQADYDSMIGSCDVGMIFLDYRFSIPNFPSRLLGYMQAKLPVLAVTDLSTDVGKVINDGDFGWWCKSNDENGFVELVHQIISDNRTPKGNNAYFYVRKHYSIGETYEIICQRVKHRN